MHVTNFVSNRCTFPQPQPAVVRFHDRYPPENRSSTSSLRRSKVRLVTMRSPRATTDNRNESRVVIPASRSRIVPRLSRHFIWFRKRW
ncbi:hypothetical protein X992_5602 [Burkholderia pseudomallei MSHR5492]|nr:hypothetical protein X992_5602 [Burkholderia pseudomallei MSHR5492]